MCELFERGIIHELWIAAEAGVRAVYENQSRMQRYDASLNKIAGSFQECTNGCYNDPQNRVNCSVSVRMQELNKGRGPGCFTHAAGHALENMRDAIPYIRDNGNRFFYFGMRQRYGLPYDRLYDFDCFLGQPAAERKCSFPSPTTLRYAADFGPVVHVRQLRPGLRRRAPQTQHLRHRCRRSSGLRALRHERRAEWYRHHHALQPIGLARGHEDGGVRTPISRTATAVGKRTCARACPDTRTLLSTEAGAPMKNWWPFLFY